MAKMSKLELENKEFQRLLPQIEQDRVELQKMKQTLETDNAVLRERYLAADERHNRDLEIIAELEDKRGIRDAHSISATDDLTALDNLLESRQNNTDEVFRDWTHELHHQLSRLNAEHTVLAHDSTSTEVFQRIREQVAFAHRNKTDLETRFANLERQIYDGIATEKHSETDKEIEAAKQMIEKAFSRPDSSHEFQVENSLETHVTDLMKTITVGRERLVAQSEVHRRFLLTPVEIVPAFSSRPRPLSFPSVTPHSIDPVSPAPSPIAPSISSKKKTFFLKRFTRSSNATA